MNGDNDFIWIFLICMLPFWIIIASEDTTTDKVDHPSPKPVKVLTMPTPSPFAVKPYVPWKGIPYVRP